MPTFNFQNMLDAQNLAHFLWFGLGVLSIAYVVFSRTRWGAARPLSKCVILSVLAHLLLIGFAYVTQLFRFEPPPEPQRLIRVSLVETSDFSREHPEREQPAALQPWNELAARELPQPEEVNLERRKPLPETPLERASDPSPRMVESDLAENLPTDAETHPPVIEPAEDGSPRILETSLPAEEIAQLPEEPSTEPSSIPPSPALETLARPESPIEAINEPPTPTQPGATSAESFELGSEPAMTETAVVLPIAEAVIGTADRLDAAVNVPGRAPANWTHVNPVAPTPIQTTVESRPQVAGEMRTASLPRRQGDGAPLPPVYGLRVAEDRATIAQQLGASRESEAAVQAALGWLARNQSADGRWDADRHEAGNERRPLGQERERAGADADTGMTALAILAFLGNGHTHLQGDYRRHVQHGLEFLLRSQAEDGNLAGEATLFARMYCHGMASLALSEAYAVTGDERLLPYVQRAIGYTLAAQHATTGGWRYQPGEQGDLSQFGWQVMALKSAEQAGIAIPARNRALMLRFLQSVSSGRNGGLGSYRRGERPTAPMTAEGLACRYFLEGRPTDGVVNEAVELILQEPPREGVGNLYYWYYATLALHQIQDRRWDAWNTALQRELLARQVLEGENAGSWNPDICLWGGYGGRVYATSMAALSLEVYYRYLPLYVLESR